MAVPGTGQLQWRCRRGMKELDLLLEGFLLTQYPHCDEAARRAFERLLEYADCDLHACLALGMRPSDPDLRRVVEKIVHAAP